MAYLYSDYLKFLKEKGLLQVINRYVDTNYEMAEVTDRQASLPSGGKALLFENNGTGFSIVTNLFSSQQKIAAALGVTNLDDAAERLVSFIQSSYPTHLNKSLLRRSSNDVGQYAPHTLSTGPCQEIAMFPPDLNRIPFLRNRQYDQACCLTTGQLYIKNPYKQTFYVSSTRMQWHSKDTAQVRIEPSSPVAQFIHATQSNTVPVAICFGGDPLYTLSSFFHLKTDLDPLILAGYMRKKSIGKVTCLSQPIEIPENSDLVIEGYIDKNDALMEAVSCGEHTGFYSIGIKEPLLHVTCITHRRNPVIPQFLPGNILARSRGTVSRIMSRFLNICLQQTVSPEISRFIIPSVATYCNMVLVSIDKFYNGQVYKVAHTIWGNFLTALNKLLIVTDQDVDIRSMRQLHRVLLENYNPATDTFFSRGPLSLLDHSAPQNGFGGKICIDATAKTGRHRNVPPDSKTPAICFYHAKVGYMPEKIFPDSLIYVRLDDTVDTSCNALCLWQTISNTDPIRDVRLVEGKLFVDACSKRPGDRGVTRPWPNVCCSKKETIEAVDGYWDRLMLGNAVPSPSLRFQCLLRGEQAMMPQNNTQASISQEAPVPTKSL